MDSTGTMEEMEPMNKASDIDPKPQHGKEKEVHILKKNTLLR